MAPARSESAGQVPDARVLRTRNDILRAAVELLKSEGLEGVTHPHLAEVAGYSRATLYNHWPNRTALLRDAFAFYGGGGHITPTGDLRADLIAELTKFRAEMEEHQVDRALAILAALAAFTPELADVRDELVVKGETVLRQILSPVFRGPALEAAVLMLSGAVLKSALLYGQMPSDGVITAAVDLTLCSVSTGR